MKRVFVLLTLVSIYSFGHAAVISIDVTRDRAPISPYIYGVNIYGNSDDPVTYPYLDPGINWGSRRLGGNRATGYNWENNASNAGSDYGPHQSDAWWCTVYGTADCTGTGALIERFVTDSYAKGWDPVVTIQMAGFVAADKNGTNVTTAAAAGDTSDRWKTVVFEKPGAFSLNPDTSDEYVYMDEFVNWMVDKFGGSGAANGVKMISLDNEPVLWDDTHPLIHPDPVTYLEVKDRTVQLASAVKNVDPGVELFSPVLYGWSAYQNLNSAADAATEGAGYTWFVDYFLDKMQEESLTYGSRLIDVLDVHWYPEANGNNCRIVYTAYDGDCPDPDDHSLNSDARMQAPRSLWDPSYTEDSWIGGPIRLIPRLQESIDNYYPGTKIAVTEYDYGGGTHYSAGIAQADVLGIFGRYGVYAAYLWDIEEGPYTLAGVKLYRNYDGSLSTYGDTNVYADTDNVTDMPVYASQFSSDDTELHIIIINRSGSARDADVAITGPHEFDSGRVWAFDSSSYTITERTAVAGMSGNSFIYNVPAYTAMHFVLEASVLTATITPTTTPTTTPTMTSTITPTMTPTHTPISAPEMMTMSEFMTEFKSTVAADSSGYFEMLTDPVIESSFETLADALMNNDISAAQTETADLDSMGIRYKLVEITDASGASPVYGFMETVLPGDPDYKGWGSALFRPDTNGKVVYQAPHVRADLYSEDITAQGFKENENGAVFMLGGTHRHAKADNNLNSYSDSDVAHETDNLFHKLTEHLAQQGSAASAPYFFVQIHGAIDRLAEPDITGSNGADTQTHEQGDYIIQVDDYVDAQGNAESGVEGWVEGTEDIRDGDYYLKATTNIQGDMLESLGLRETFMHFEIERTLRDDYNAGSGAGFLGINDLLDGLKFKLTDLNAHTPTMTNTITDSPTASMTGTPVLSLTATPTITLTQTASFTQTQTESFTPTITLPSAFTDTATPTMTFTPTASQTAANSAAPTETVTQTAAVSLTFIISYTPTPTITPQPTPALTSAPTEDSGLIIDKTFPYPNPYSPDTGVRLKVVFNTTQNVTGITFRLYTSALRLIRVVKVPGPFTAGRQHAEISPAYLTGLGGGVYLYVITAEDAEGAKKRSVDTGEIVIIRR